jgi:hypothetical protein
MKYKRFYIALIGIASLMLYQFHKPDNNRDILLLLDLDSRLEEVKYVTVNCFGNRAEFTGFNQISALSNALIDGGRLFRKNEKQFRTSYRTRLCGRINLTFTSGRVSKSSLYSCKDYPNVFAVRINDTSKGGGSIIYFVVESWEKLLSNGEVLK